MRGRAARAIVLLAGLLLRTALAAAQTTGAAPPPAPRPSCLDVIPDSMLRRAPVYLAAIPVDSSPSHVRLGPGIDLLTQTVAQTARMLLGAQDGTLPHAEPAIDWRSLDGDVTIVAHRDGRIDARVTPPRGAAADWTRDAGARLVARALDTAYARGERLFFPDSLAADSLRWRLHLAESVLDEQGAIRPPKMRFGVPIFSVKVPPQRQVSVEGVRVRYPDRLRRSGFMGNVKMEFVVDTTGRVDEATIRDVYPAGAPPLTVTERAAYDSFLRAIREGLHRGRYRPAMVGGCLVRQMVEQPFTFSLGDGRPPGP